MRATVRKLSVAAAFALLAALLAGCVRMDVRLKINADGSADYGLDMMAENAVVDGAKALGQDVFAKATQDLQAEGLTVEPLQADGFSGIRAAGHYGDVSKIGGSLDLLGGSVGENFSVKSEKGFFGTKYTVHANVDAAAILGSQPGLAELLKQAAGQSRFTFTITLPQKAGSHNANSVDAAGLTYTWDMKLDQPAPIDLAVTVPNWTNILLAGGGALVVVLLAVILLAVASARKKKSAAQRMRIRSR